MPSLGQRLIEKGRDQGIQQGVQQEIQQGMSKGRVEGMQQGMSKGRTEEKRASVVRMFNEGVNIDDIPRYTGLSKKEVEKVLEN